MTTRNRAIDVARRQWNRTLDRIGDELRAARHVRGIRQQDVAQAIGVSQSEISLRERGLVPNLGGRDLADHAAAIGLKLAVTLWPAGGGVRDMAQARYIAAFLARMGRRWRVTLEAVVPLPGDLRAADILLEADAIRIVVEVITRLADLQAQIRAAQAKARDLGATRLIMVVASTHANRAALAAVQGAVAQSFDLDSRRLLAELAAGRDPGRDGILFLAA